MKAVRSLFILAACAITGFCDNAVVGVLSAPGGRYVFGQVSMARADQYLLDTQSGRMWQIAKSKEGSMVLEPVLFVASDDGYSLLPTAVGQKISSASPAEPTARSAELDATIVDALAKWMANTQANDPRYGQYEAEIRRQLRELWDKSPPPNVQNALAVADLIYKNVKAEFDLGKEKRFKPGELIPAEDKRMQPRSTGAKTK